MGASKRVLFVNGLNVTFKTDLIKRHAIYEVKMLFFCCSNENFLVSSSVRYHFFVRERELQKVMNNSRIKVDWSKFDCHL